MLAGRAVARLARDRAGSAGVEFGLVAPILLTLWLGTIELTHAFRVQMKVSTAAGRLAELVAARQSVTAPAGSLADLCAGAMINMYPYATSSFSADIASLTNDHPSNRVAGSTDATSVKTYLDWENLSSCAAAAQGSLGLAGAFALANTPLSLLTKTGAPASGTSDANLVTGASAIVVLVRYPYANVLPSLLGTTVTFSAVALVRPRANNTVECTNVAGTTACPLTQ